MTLPTKDKKFFLAKVMEFLVCKDPIHEMLKWILDEFMRAESEIKVGAEKNKHSQDRKTYFSGYRPRRFDTRLGTFYFLVPKLRNGGYIPFFLQEKKRSETALISLVREAYINGVSTRKDNNSACRVGRQAHLFILQRCVLNTDPSRKYHPNLDHILLVTNSDEMSTKAIRRPLKHNHALLD